MANTAGRCNDAAGERGQTGDHQRFIHEERTNHPSKTAHTGQTGQTDHDGFPLLKQTLEAKERPHMGDQQKDGDRTANGQQLRVCNDGLRKKRPEAAQNNDCRNKD